MYQEIDGDLIGLARNGQFDVITHGCNCLSNMGAGIAVAMKNTFGCNNFRMELVGPSILKLGNIDFEDFLVSSFNVLPADYNGLSTQELKFPLTVINSYTQYEYGGKMPLSYDALVLCLRKINYMFKGKHIGLPKIGCGLAGGDWNTVRLIIKNELKGCKVTVVNYKK